MTRPLPWWVNLPLAFVAVAGPVAALDPTGTAVGISHLCETGEMARLLEVERREGQRLDAATARSVEVMTYKHELMAALAAGDTSLAAVTDELIRLHGPGDPIHVHLRVYLGDMSDAELMACHAMALVRRLVPPTSDGRLPAALARLRVEFEHQFGHPAPASLDG